MKHTINKPLDDVVRGIRFAQALNLAVEMVAARTTIDGPTEQQKNWIKEWHEVFYNILVTELEDELKNRQAKPLGQVDRVKSRDIAIDDAEMETIEED